MNATVKQLSEENISLRRELDAATHEIDRLRLRLAAGQLLARKSLQLARQVNTTGQELECLLDGTQRKGEES